MIGVFQIKTIWLPAFASSKEFISSAWPLLISR
jgi:hypothetical protein